jgi:hypothetical protein
VSFLRRCWSLPALLQRLRPQVDAAQHQQVEGVEEHLIVVSLAVELLEVRHAVGIAADRLAVEDKGALTKAPPRPGSADTERSNRSPNG